MVSVRSINPLLRAVGVIGVVASLVTAVTFAALTSSATLTGNTLNSATAGLFVANGDTDATSNTAPGFAFNNLAPGGGPSAPQKFNLKNSGGVPLNVTVYATNSAVTGTLDNSKVIFCFTQIDTATPIGPACYNRDQMLSSFNDLPGNPLVADNDNHLYQVTVELQDGATTGSGGASVGAFDLVFTGTQVIGG